MANETLPESVTKAVVAGIVAGAVTAFGLALLSRVERRHPLAAINASSHWLIGDENVRTDHFDPKQTLIGCFTHFAATIFGASVLESLKTAFVARVHVQLAFLTSLMAVVLDYGILPRRISPGWELALSKWSMAGGFGFLGIGLAIGSAVASRLAGRTQS